MNQTFSLTVNGKPHEIEADPDMPLLYALRDDSASTIRASAAGSPNAAPARCMSTAQATRSCVTPVSAAGNGRSRRWPGSARRRIRIRCRPPISRSRCRSAATASTAGS